MLNTMCPNCKIILLTSIKIFRDLRKDAQLLQYGDNLESLSKSAFDPAKPSKVLIHGFKGSGKEKGALSGVQEFLKLVRY